MSEEDPETERNETNEGPVEDREVGLPGGDEDAASKSAAAPTAPSRLEPAAVFSIVGDDVRLGIVASLHESPPQTPLSFSDLYERVDVSDSGQFNYHLSQLVPHLVSKSEDGYELTSAGRRLARAVAAGMYTDSPTLEPTGVEGDCTSCGREALEAAYHDEFVHITCRECDHTVLRVSAPPSLVRGREPDEALDAFETWSGWQVSAARKGLCPTCGGAVEPTQATDLADQMVFDVLPRFDCSVCGRSVTTSFGNIAVAEPPVGAFHRRHGVDLETRPYWTIEQFVTADHQEVLSESPFRVRVTFTAGGESCHVVIDEANEVIRTEIERD